MLLGEVLAAKQIMPNLMPQATKATDFFLALAKDTADNSLLFQQERLSKIE
jgi:hypothetical protein